ncbi:hypothetical protein H312_01901 [Anncaliia algerae PRA339]|uniref:Uncharacterized protein n=1 Tax=Anncaliia algerae PRA339 TaxID=1288291 RepID=A0A059F077_9MICR|nr:hypothetical protein H312_01901 [Anncaliia algerae PRA339]
MSIIISFFLACSNQIITLNNFLEITFDNISVSQEAAINSIKNLIFLSSQVNEILTHGLSSGLCLREHEEVTALKTILEESLNKLPQIISRESQLRNAKNKIKRFFKSLGRKFIQEGNYYRILPRLMKTLNSNLINFVEKNTVISSNLDTFDFYVKSTTKIFEIIDLEGNENLTKEIDLSAQNYVKKDMAINNLILKYEKFNKAFENLFSDEFVDEKDSIMNQMIFFLKIFTAISKRSTEVFIRNNISVPFSKPSNKVKYRNFDECQKMQNLFHEIRIEVTKIMLKKLKKYN